MTKEELYNLNLEEIAAANAYVVPAAEQLDRRLAILNVERDAELELFIVDNIAMNEDLLKTMSVAHTMALDTENIEWIGYDNAKVILTKEEFGALIRLGVDKIKEIYFRYRQLKDEAIQRLV